MRESDIEDIVKILSRVEERKAVHNTSPETKKMIDDIKINCNIRGNEMARLTQEFNDFKKNQTKLMAEVRSTNEKILDKLDQNYVTKKEFMPIKQLVYGSVSLVLVAVITALISLVIKQ